MLYKYLLVEIDAEFGQQSVVELTFVTEDQMQEQKKKCQEEVLNFR